MNIDIKPTIREFAIAFVDMVGSSTVSKVKGHEEYFKIIQEYHNCVKECKRKYLENKFKLSYLPDPRGDEGVFIVSDPITLKDNNEEEQTIFDVIKFTLFLKLEWLLCQKERSVPDHNLIDLAAGIHFDKLAYNYENPTKIDEIEGYAINYAKRIESVSRIGQFSNIFISAESYALIKEKEFFFKKYDGIRLKDLSDNETIYEVKDFFIKDDDLLKLSSQISKYKNALNDIRNKILLNWLDDIIISFYYTKLVVEKKDTIITDLWSYLENIRHKDSDVVKFINLLIYKLLDLPKISNIKEKIAGYMYLIKGIENILKNEPSFQIAKFDLLKTYKEFIKLSLSNPDNKLRRKDIFSYIIDLKIQKLLSEEEKEELLNMFWK